MLVKRVSRSLAFFVLLAATFPVFAAGTSVSGSASASPVTNFTQYRLRLYHLHTGEHIDVVYRVGNHYLPAAVAELDHFLRDHRTGAVKAYDVHEFDLLHDLMARLGRPNGEIDIVCGYRSPWSNTYLRDHTQGVALHSQHMMAKAIDIRVPGVPSAEVRDVALAMHRGGVGYYPISNFVHVDVGPVRHWQFVPVGGHASR